MKELSEESKFNISIKSLVGIGVGLSMLIGMYFTLQAEITEAKELPVPEVSRTEYDLKAQLIRETIMNTQSDVEEIKEDIEGLDDKLDKMQETVSSINRVYLELGRLAATNHNYLHELAGRQDQLTLLQGELKTEYGTDDINIQDGIINYPKENGEVNKKD